MEFIDRQGQNLNRKKLTIISQTPTEMIVDVARYDNATTEGTPINANVFNSLQQGITTANSTAASALSKSNEALSTSASAVSTSNLAETTASQANTSAANAVLTANQAMEQVNALESAVADRGATVYVNNESQASVHFTSDPQDQIDTKLNKSFNSYSSKSSLLTNDILVVQDAQTSQNSSISVNTLTSTILNVAYPVGAIYMSVNSTNPDTLFGGTWEAWGAGRVPLAVGNNGESNYSVAEATGGSENSLAYHTHLQNAHNHVQEPHGHSDSGHSHGLTLYYSGSNGSPGTYGSRNSNPTTFTTSTNFATINDSTAENFPETATNQYAGVTGGNRMPYITCYMWKRIG